MMHASSLRRFLIRFACSAILTIHAAHACTTFCMDVNGRPVFGANYDWDTGVGLLMVNKRAVAKVALTGRPAMWPSRFASITFNQYGTAFPTGGLKEAGLVVPLLAGEEPA